jgi:hypothetical protein
MAARSMIFLHERLDTPLVAMNKNRFELKILVSVTLISILSISYFFMSTVLRDAPRGFILSFNTFCEQLRKLLGSNILKLLTVSGLSR